MLRRRNPSDAICVLEVTVVVRAAMPQRQGHRLEQRTVRCTPEAGYAAHVSGSPASILVGA